MHFHGAVVTLLGVASVVFAVPTGTAHGQSQLPNGLPNPSQSQLAQIEENAHGTLPNAPPPSNISADGITNLKLIALNELFEVAFFNELLLNITNNVTGYEFSDKSDRDFAIKSFTAILAVSDPLQIIFVH
jgi:hypothetical protein